jgi:hypothetical protein
MKFLVESDFIGCQGLTDFGLTDVISTRGYSGRGQTLSRNRMGQSGRKGGKAGQGLSLTPGMAASVEIATGDRRIIGFVLSPIAKATSEAGRER